MFSDLIGKPFVYGASGDAYDCYTLYKEVARRVGMIVPEHPSCIDLKDRSSMIIKGLNLYKKIKNPKPYCLVTFKQHTMLVTHIGFVLKDKLTFIHTQKITGVRINKLKDPLWKFKIEGFYEFIG